MGAGWFGQLTVQLLILAQVLFSGSQVQAPALGSMLGMELTLKTKTKIKKNKSEIFKKMPVSFSPSNKYKIQVWSY